MTDGGGDLIGLLVLTVAGLVAGYVNAIAGAGSLLTLPALIFTGLEPVSANATNRVAVVSQTAAALFALRRGGQRPSRVAAVLTIPAVLGGIAGAAAAGRVGQDGTRLAIAIAMPVFLLLGAFRPGGADDASPLTVRPSLVLAFFVFGLYAGFLQAGIGVLVLLVLGSGFGVDLIEANLAKLLAVLVLTVAALGTFLAQGVPVDPVRGAALALATMVGGYVGGRASLRGGAGLIRVALVVAVLGSAGKLAWDAVR